MYSRTILHAGWMVLLVALSPGGQVAVWPGKEWATASPESRGVSSAALEEAAAYAQKYGGGSGCIIRHGYLVKEWGDANRLADIKSATKGSVGATLLGLALDAGLVGLDDPVQKHSTQLGAEKPENTATGWLREITVHHLATMTAGFDDGRPPKLLNRPGTAGFYSNDTSNMLAELLTLRFNEDLYEVLKRKVMDPIGAPPSDWAWRANNYRPRAIGGLISREFASGITITHRALARIGYLYLREGNWNGSQILSSEFIAQATRPTSLPAPWPYYAFYWGSNARGTYAEIPADTYWALGLGDSFVVVCPSLDLVAVRLGLGSTRSQLPTDPPEDWGKRVAGFFKVVVAGIKDAPRVPQPAAPYPPSPVIQSIEWAPRESIIRQAQGSDNWPVTWADDGHLYTAYGDGQGFLPHAPRKLSLGFARILGMPPRFLGENIPSATGEQMGDGAAGRKASGLLMVEGVLYLWARNAGNSQLAWSSDHGRTWTWSDWKFLTSFGSPTFLNFGKDYESALDNYVYVYSHDSESAYTAADGMVLARVPKKRLREHGAYEFFKRLDEKGRAVWTREITERGAVFTHRNRCYRSGISFSAGLKRYLWCQTLPGTDARFRGGFGIYDAPEPWGPWTTVFYTETWDVGPGETSSFPTKWMSADGRTLHLVFSGDDAFAVRQATLDIADRREESRDTGFFPPPESMGSWRKLDRPDEIRRLAGMDPDKLASLRGWLLESDQRNFAAVVIRNGTIALEVERGSSSQSDTGNIKSCAKAICATVLAIASEESRKGRTPKKMSFEDPAFDFIPWARPLSDPRKARIKVKQLLNHTSGLAPESTGARNQGPWEYVLGHSGNPRTSQLAFDPGAGLGYSTHGFYHAALVCEDVTGMPYDRFAIRELFEPLGVETWWFEVFHGGPKYGAHPSHALGLPARDMARIAYCMLREGRWKGRQVIPKWFVEQTGRPTHSIRGTKDFGREAATWSHGWELPARLTDARGRAIPKDARFKPGSGGQLIAFVPSLDLVVVRQTGGSGQWEYEEYLRRACDAVQK